MGLDVSVRQPTLAVGAGLLLVSVTAWAALLAMGDEMPMGAGLWIGAWTVMMAAMMLPSTSPLVLLYARQSTATSSNLPASRAIFAPSPHPRSSTRPPRGIRAASS